MDRKLRDEMRRLCATYRWKAEFEASPACTPTPEVSCKQSRAAFKRRRDALVQAAFARMNRVVFRGRMPEDLPIQWSKTLTTTAGITRFVGNSCSVELSEKAIDSEERLETTLIHELCHVAVFVLDQATKQPPHGAAFRKWADLAESELGCEVTTCHSFDIFTPHKFRCTNDECGQTYGRHSKKGIDTEKKVCGRCTGRLEYQGRFDADGKKSEQKPLNLFSQHVKENFSAVRAALPPGTPHKQVMRELAQAFKAASVEDSCIG